MDQLSLFNLQQREDDGFKYDNNGNFIGININRFSRWWKNHKKEQIELDKRIDETLIRGRMSQLETKKMIEEWKQHYKTMEEKKEEYKDE